MENQKKQPLNKKLLAGVVALIAAVAVLAAVYFGTRPAASAGEKTITVTVAAHGEEEAFTIKTDEEYLRGALESIDLIEGSESEYGLFVTTVNGVAADDSKLLGVLLSKVGSVRCDNVKQLAHHGTDSPEMYRTAFAAEGFG